MLQIASKMYYPEGTPLNSTIHRSVLHTNCGFITPDRKAIEFPIGAVLPDTGWEPVTAVTVEIIDNIPEPGEGQGGLIATGGTELVDAFAHVLSFALNAVFSRNHDLVHRLVGEGKPRPRGGQTGLFKDTFTPRRTILEPDIARVREFMNDLLALERSHFEKAMRAIKQTVLATLRAADDPTGAYTDMVAALESLSDDELGTKAEWSQYPSDRRPIIDAALEGLDDATADSIRDAIMEAEYLGLRRRFINSTTARVGPEFYRAEAAESQAPLRAPDLEKALDLAYKHRSKKSHVLLDLPGEIWLFTGNETHELIDGTGTILTLEGLLRLVRHVIRRYIADAPKGIDPTFDYREHLPGIYQVRLSPEYWIGRGEDFSKETVLPRLTGVTEVCVAMLGGQTEGLPDLTTVLEKIETIVPGLAPSTEKSAMVGIYQIWHTHLAPQFHQPDPVKFLEKHGACTDEPSFINFVIALLTRGLPTEWTLEQYLSVADTRRAERAKPRHFDVPPQFDACLLLEVADQLEEAGRHDDALKYAAYAVEELPGNPMLIEWERRLIANDHDPKTPYAELLFGTGGSATAEDGTAETPEDPASEDPADQDTPAG